MIPILILSAFLAAFAGPTAMDTSGGTPTMTVFDTSGGTPTVTDTSGGTPTHQ